MINNNMMLYPYIWRSLTNKTSIQLNIYFGAFAKAADHKVCIEITLVCLNCEAVVDE